MTVELRVPVLLRREWGMPNRHTFDILAIADVVKRHHQGRWCDPFAGWGSPAALRNDLNPQAPTHAHQDALEWLQSLAAAAFDGAFYDPPYSPRQAAECYKSLGLGHYLNEGYWSAVKDELARVIRPGGIAVCCGWNSNGLGASRGFTLEEVLLVAHGAHHHDTIVTVERAALRRAESQP